MSRFLWFSVYKQFTAGITNSVFVCQKLHLPSQAGEEQQHVLEAFVR